MVLLKSFYTKRQGCAVSPDLNKALPRGCPKESARSYKDLLPMCKILTT